MKADTSTTVIPASYFSPLSYSCSTRNESQQQHSNRLFAARPPPPPSAVKVRDTISVEGEENENEMSRLLSFSQEMTPLSYKHGLNNSNNLMKSVEHLSLSPVPMKKEPSSPTMIGLRDRTNSAALKKQPYPEMTPLKKRTFSRQSSTNSRMIPSKVRPPSGDFSKGATPHPKSKLMRPPRHSIGEDSSGILGTSLLQDVTMNSMTFVPDSTPSRSTTIPHPMTPTTFRSDGIHVSTPAAHGRDATQFQTPARTRRTHFTSNSPKVQFERTPPLPNEFSIRSELSLPDHVRTPEDAKQLLKVALSTLRNARRERQEAREWAKDFQATVHEWANKQRELLSCEAANKLSTIEQHEERIRNQTSSMARLDKCIQQLVSECHAANTHQRKEQGKVEQLLNQQHDRMDTVSKQLANMEQCLSEATSSARSAPGTKGNSPLKADHNVKEEPVPKFVDHKTASQQDNAGTPRSNSSANRRKYPLPNGSGHVVLYGNGVLKEFHTDGTTVVRFLNGDVETTFAGSQSVAYFHSKEKVTEIVTDEGRIFEYANGQVERHEEDGSKSVLFPDGTKQHFDSKGVGTTVQDR